MCGIVGLINRVGSKIEPNVIEKMTLSIKHRGPTSGGKFLSNNVGIGNRRLAIIDLKTGDQPKSNETNDLWITYNGEIYNFLEIQLILLKKGHMFSTNSDTEVIIHAYEEWGKNCVTHFRGMFSFAIVDLRNNTVFIARDHLGIKPLYYAITNEYFAFSSEIQAFYSIPNIKFTLNLDAIDYYLSLQYIPAPITIYTEMHKLKPGNYMVVDFNGNIQSITEYWDLKYNPINNKTVNYWVDATEDAIQESVNAHLISDVPFGAFLSGGIDSSIVVNYMSKKLKNPVMAFNIDFEDQEYSEGGYAKYVANYFQLEFFSEIIKPNALDILPLLVKHYGEPFGDSSAIPTYYLSKLASQHVPMVLTGDGGDEGFLGYARYASWMRYYSGNGLPKIKKIIRPLASFFLPEKYSLKPNLNRWLKYIQYFSKDRKKLLWREGFYNKLNNDDLKLVNTFDENSHLNHLQHVQYFDLKNYLPYDILTKVDVASMMHGLETRTPLVDKNLLEFLLTIPSDVNFMYKDGQWIGKKILKTILERNFPKDFINRKKMGFAVPLKYWFSEEKDSDNLIFSLFFENPVLTNLFNKEILFEIFSRGETGNIWLILFLSEWLNQNQSSFHY